MPRKLRNIRLSEISIVDLPANKKKFFVVKRDGATTEPSDVDEAVAIVKSLLGAEPPADFATNIAAYADGERAGMLALLRTAASYGDAMPESLCKSVAGLALAAAQPAQVELDKADQAKVSELKDKGNTIINALSALLDEARANGGRVKDYAVSLVMLEELVSNIKWFIESCYTPVPMPMPTVSVQTGLASDTPLGKAAGSADYNCPKCKKTFAVKLGPGNVDAISDNVRCPACDVKMSRVVEARKVGRKLSKENLGKIKSALQAFKQLVPTLDALKELVDGVEGTDTEKAEPAKCPRCGATGLEYVSDGLWKCPKCGRTTSEQATGWGKNTQKAATNSCPFCGSEKIKPAFGSPGTYMCNACGKTFRVDLNKQTLACPKCQKQFVADVSKSAKGKCPHCGAAGVVKANCPKCGGTLRVSPSGYSCGKCGAEYGWSLGHGESKRAAASTGKCPKCGASVSIGDRTTGKCPECGTMLKRKENKAMMQACPKCGGMMLATATVCPHCGKPTDDKTARKAGGLDYKCPKCGGKSIEFAPGSSQGKCLDCGHTGGRWEFADRGTRKAAQQKGRLHCTQCGKVTEHVKSGAHDYTCSVCGNVKHDASGNVEMRATKTACPKCKGEFPVRLDKAGVNKAWTETLYCPNCKAMTNHKSSIDDPDRRNNITSTCTRCGSTSTTIRLSRDGKLTCPYCKSTGRVSKMSLFCPTCGKRTEHQYDAGSNSMKCSECGDTTPARPNNMPGAKLALRCPKCKKVSKSAGATADGKVVCVHCGASAAIRKEVMRCNECGATFNKKIGPNTYEVKCPKCGSYDTEPTSQFGKAFGAQTGGAGGFLVNCPKCKTQFNGVEKDGKLTCPACKATGKAPVKKDGWSCKDCGKTWSTAPGSLSNQCPYCKSKSIEPFGLRMGKSGTYVCNSCKSKGPFDVVNGKLKCGKCGSTDIGVSGQKT